MTTPPDTRTLRSAAVPAAAGGIVATGAGLGASVLVAALLGSTSPVAAIGEGVIAVLPGPLVNFGKETLGFADKPILLLLVTVVALALGAAAGILERRRDWLGWLVLVPLAALSFIAAVTRPDIGVAGALLPVVAAIAVTAPLLRAMSTRARAWEPGADPEGRRGFLAWILGGTAIAAVGVGAGAAVGRLTGPTVPPVPLPTPTAPVPVPAGAELAIKGLSPYLTPNRDFYRIDTALVVPRVSTDRWQLVVTGMVERTITLDYPQLLARDLVEHVATLTCVSNEVGGGLAGNARWLGLPIRELLAEAGPLPGADMVLSRSADGWTAGTPLEVLTDPDRQSLLAVGMNGEPLPREHGHPVRMVVPGLYGYVSATKWVVELKVTTFAEDQGYWTPLGWSALGPIKLASRIDVPGGEVTAGEVVVAGVAWAQHTGIAAVEVQVDGGPWQPATLAEVTGPDTWRQWSWRWQATTGQHTLRCRAQDADGNWQTEAEAPPAPDGATGLHSRAVPVAMA